MTDLTPQQKYDLGTKYKKAGILVAVIGILASSAVGGGLWCHGRNLQLEAMQAVKLDAKGTLTIVDEHGNVIHANGAPVVPAAPLGGKADGSGKAK